MILPKGGYFLWPENLLGEKIGPQPECVWAMISINVVCQLGVLVPISRPWGSTIFWGGWRFWGFFCLNLCRFLDSSQGITGLRKIFNGQVNRTLASRDDGIEWCSGSWRGLDSPFGKDEVSLFCWRFFLVQKSTPKLWENFCESTSRVLKSDKLHRYDGWVWLQKFHMCFVLEGVRGFELLLAQWGHWIQVAGGLGRILVWVCIKGSARDDVPDIYIMDRTKVKGICCCLPSLLPSFLPSFLTCLTCTPLTSEPLRFFSSLPQIQVGGLNMW